MTATAVQNSSLLLPPLAGVLIEPISRWSCRLGSPVHGAMGGTRHAIDYWRNLLVCLGRSCIDGIMRLTRRAFHCAARQFHVDLLD